VSPEESARYVASVLRRLADKLEQDPEAVEKFLGEVPQEKKRRAPQVIRFTSKSKASDLPFNAIAEFHQSGQDIEMLEERLNSLRKEDLWRFVERFPQSSTVSKKALKKELVSFLSEVISSTTMRDDYFTS